MGVNKFILDGVVEFDISNDTVTADKLLRGITAHNADGDAVTGTCDYDSDTSDGTATANDVLDGKIAYSDGVRVVGNMPNIGQQTGSIATKEGKVMISAGHHDGSGYVGLNATEKAKLIGANIAEGVTLFGVAGTHKAGADENPEVGRQVTPTFADQTITPASGYTCFKQLVVKAIPVTRTAHKGGTLITVG